MKVKLICIAICLLMLQGCVGTAVSAASSAVIEVAKVPFKVAGAVVSGVAGSGKDEKEEE